MPIVVALRPAARGGLSVYPVEAMLAFGVDAFVTGRHGGVSDPPFDELNLGDHVGDDPGHVAQNRRRVAGAAGVDVSRLVIARQVHGHHVAEVRGPVSAFDADGIVTASSDLAVAVLVADCVPILLVDGASARFAVVHAGWRGLAERVLANALTHFDDAASVHAFIGPSISGRTYQVGPEVARHFDDVPGALAPDAADRSLLDLRRVSVHQLLTLGVADARLSVSEQSTDGASLFFSDRAARPCGRFALVARRRSMRPS